MGRETGATAALLGGVVESRENAPWRAEPFALKVFMAARMGTKGSLRGRG